MTCSASCGSDRELMELLIENAINKALVEGKLQAGLKDCGNGSVGKDAKVILCGTLVATVNEAIKNGEIDVVKNVEIEDGKLVVTAGTGAVVKKDIPGIKSVKFKDNKLVVTPNNGDAEETALPYPTASVGGKSVVFTQPSGVTFEVPKVGSVLTGDDFDITIKKGTNTPDKYGVAVKENGGLEVTANGLAVKGGDGVVVNPDGSVSTTGVSALKPILGNGTKGNPLKLALSDRDFDVNAVSGEISLKAVRTQAVTDLNNGVQVMGYSTFYGNVDKARGLYALGVPPAIDSTEVTQNSTSTIAELKDGEKYDFNGWQISSPAQVDQYIVGNDNAVWHRTNDFGMNNDGTFKNPNGWSVWHRETNVPVSVVQLDALQRRVDDLTKRVTALEEILAGFVPLKDASGTETLGLIKP